MWVWRQVERERSYDPPEGRAAATIFRNAANDLRSLANQVNSVRMNLQESWYGTAKNIFFENSSDTPKALNNHANVLDQLAGEAEKPVTITELVWECVYEED